MPHEFKQWLLSPKLIRRVGWHSVPTLTHWCPGCNYEHDYAVEQPFESNKAQWTYNGDPLHPSFSPSMNYQVNPKNDKHYQADLPSKTCHYFVKLGRELPQTPPLAPAESYIQFLNDCTHALKGQIVLLPDLPIRRDGKWRFFGSTIITEEEPPA